MKKMQCEICGSTEIKKVDDTTFECQSCGVQYSKDEVQKLLVEITGNVKIDHSEEVENAIKRGEQFENAGDNKKAEEYYNKALDMDADNKVAQEKIKKSWESQQFDEYFIIEPKVSPEENVKHFLKQLATTKNIACDIYKEIGIKKVYEKFYTFMFMKGKYRSDWSLTACHKYYENQPVSKEEYDYTLKRYRTVLKTEKVERIQRVPMSGTHIYDAEQLALGSKNIDKDMSSLSGLTARALISEFEQLQTEKYAQYNPKKIDSKKVEKEDGVYKYKGIPLDLTIDNKLYQTKISEMRAAADQKAADEVMAGINCDFCEGISATSNTLSESVAYVCIPVQVIEYTYKDVTYVAVSDLISRTTTMPMSYPCDIELANAIEELETQQEKASKSTGITVGLVIGGLGLLCLFLGMILPGTESFFIPMMLVMVAAGLLIMLISALVSKSREKSFQNNAVNVKRDLFGPRVKNLEASRDRFFEEYTDYNSAQNAAASVECIEIKNTRTELDCAGPIRKKMEYIIDVAEENEVDRDDAATILEYAIKSNKQKRNKRICVSLFGGIILCVLGVLIFGSGVWHYSIWFLALLMTVSGFGFATIGSIASMGNSNREIMDLQNCLTMYKKQKTLENEFEQPQELVVLPILKQWTPERIEQKVTELSNKKETIDAEKTMHQNDSILKKIVGWVQKHKKMSIAVASIVVGFLIAIIVETIMINAMARTYEKSLYENSFVFAETDSEYGSGRMYTDTRTYFFSKDGTYTYTAVEKYTESQEQKYFYEDVGTYKIRFKLFSGEIRLVLDKRSYEASERNNNIYEFDVYGNLYKVSDGDNITNDVLSNDSSTNNNSIENTISTSSSTNTEDEAETNTSSLNNTTNNTDTSSKPSSSNTTSSKPSTSSTTDSKPASSTQTTSKPTVAKDPCADGHSWEDATCTTPATCSVCKKTSGSALSHEIDVTKCFNCEHTDFSKIAKTYTDISSYDLTTGEDFDVQNVSISSSGVFSFTFNGEKYNLKLVQKTHSKGSYERMVQFDCYVNGSKEPDALVEVDTDYYIPRLEWKYLQGHNFYIFAE